MTVYLTSRQIRERFNISDMTLYNWRKDKKMPFPKPTKIRQRNYFNLSEVEDFEKKMKLEAAN